MSLSKHYSAEVYCVADVWEVYAASILSLEVIREVVTSFGRRFLIPTAG